MEPALFVYTELPLVFVIVPLIIVPSSPVFFIVISPFELFTGAPSIIIPPVAVLSNVKLPSTFSIEPLISIPLVPLFLSVISPFLLFNSAF